MKKRLIITAVAAIVGLTSVQFASAHGYGGDGYNGYGRGGYGYCDQYFDDSRTEKSGDVDKFREGTTEIRKNLAIKKNELRALLRQDNPDEKKVGKLTGEIFDLETELDKKAEKAGFTGRNYGHGPNMMRGYGRGYGRHMMDW